MWNTLNSERDSAVMTSFSEGPIHCPSSRISYRPAGRRSKRSADARVQEVRNSANELLPDGALDRMTAVVIDGFMRSVLAQYVVAGMHNPAAETSICVQA